MPHSPRMTRALDAEVLLDAREQRREFLRRSWPVWMRQSETRRLMYCQSCWLNSGWLRIAVNTRRRRASGCPSRACRSRRRCPWRAPWRGSSRPIAANGCAATARTPAAERERDRAGQGGRQQRAAGKSASRSSLAAESWRGYCRRRRRFAMVAATTSEEPMTIRSRAAPSSPEPGPGCRRASSARRSAQSAKPEIQASEYWAQQGRA